MPNATNTINPPANFNQSILGNMSFFFKAFSPILIPIIAVGIFGITLRIIIGRMRQLPLEPSGVKIGFLSRLAKQKKLIAFLFATLSAEATEKGFKTVRGLPAVRSRKSVSSGKQKIKVSDEVSAMEIIPNETGFPEYWNLKNKGHRILWILGYAHNNKVQSLIPKEIEYLAAKLRDNISASNVNALTGALVKKGLVATAAKKYRILQPGIGFLQNWKSESDD
jgi:hypothetical protein